MKKSIGTALLSLTSVLAFGTNTSDIYIINKTTGDLRVSEQTYKKSGYAGAENYSVTHPGFIVKPGQKKKVASLDRDQSTYPDDVSAKKSVYYDNKYATVSFSINDTSYYFKSIWGDSDSSKNRNYRSNQTAQKPNPFLPLSSRMILNHIRSIPYRLQGVAITDRYVFPKLYHDIDITFDPAIRP